MMKNPHFKKWKTLSVAIIFAVKIFNGDLKATAAPKYTVVDQDGIEKNFFDEVLRTEKVVVNFIYTNCGAVCPGQGRHFAMLQSRLEQHMGDNVQLVSVSIDPERDQPADLKRWAATFGASSTWTQVTGASQEIEALCTKILGFMPQINAHSPFIAVRDGGGRWHRMYGLSPVQDIIAKLNSTGTD